MDNVWVKIEREFSEYLEECELRGELGYSPNDDERGMMIEALAGFLSEDNTLSRAVKGFQKERGS